MVRKGGVSSRSSKAARTLKTNRRKGNAFEKKVASIVKQSDFIKTSSVKTQVRTKKRGRADIVADTKSGVKLVGEAKNYRGNPLTKSDVKQAKGYAKDLNGIPFLAVSKSTKIPPSVRKYANKSNVSINKF